MDTSSEISGFLTSRRARLTPEQAGLTLHQRNRRVPGLRREEVALLAGVSVDYYARLERGRIAGASREVLEAVARALQLDDDERAHLLDLVSVTRRRTPVRRISNRSTVRLDVQRVLDSIRAPAIVQNARLDRLAANLPARALHSLPVDGSGDRYNYAEWLFLEAVAKRFHRDFDDARHNVVALLRAATAHDPFDEQLIALIERLSAGSREFAAMWASHDVFRYRTGVKALTHPVVGDLDFGYESFDLSADPGLVMLVFSTEPGSRTEQAMALLTSWHAPAGQDART